MGSMNFRPGALADSLSETAGYKAGLALSVEELCDHLTGTIYPEIIRTSEDFGARLRSEEYEALFYKLLHRIGYTKDEYSGFAHAAARRFHKYRRAGQLEAYTGVGNIFNEVWMDLIRRTAAEGSKAIDPTPFLIKCHENHGNIGLQIAMEQIDVINDTVTLSPHSIGRTVEWSDPLQLRNRTYAE